MVNKYFSVSVNLSLPKCEIVNQIDVSYWAVLWLTKYFYFSIIFFKYLNLFSLNFSEIQFYLDYIFLGEKTIF